MKIRLGSCIQGAAGTARELLVDRECSDPPDWRAHIGGWFIEAPGQSPAWQHYLLSAIHLRPIEGVKPAVIREPGATHEFLLLAMDPARNPHPENPDSWSYLRPYNLMQQVIASNDAAVAKILDGAARAVAEGRLWAEPPLSGMFEPWRSYLQALARETP